MMDDISTVDRHVGRMEACRVIAARMQSLLDKLDEIRPEVTMLNLLLGFIEGYQDGERVKLEGQLSNLGDLEQYLKAQQAKDTAGEDKRTITVGQEAKLARLFYVLGRSHAASDLLRAVLVARNNRDDDSVKIGAVQKHVAEYYDAAITTLDHRLQGVRDDRDIPEDLYGGIVKSSDTIFKEDISE